MSVVKQTSTNISISAMNLGSHLISLVPVCHFEKLHTEFETIIGMKYKQNHLW